MTTVSAAIDPASRAAQVGILVQASTNQTGRFNFLKQKIAVIAQGATTASYSLEKTQVFSRAQAGATFGFGSPIDLICAQLLPANQDGVGSVPVYVCPLEDASGSVAAAFRITPSGTQSAAASYRVRINNILSSAFTIAANETGADLESRITSAINAVLGMPVVAAAGSNVVNMTAKWKGASGNAIAVSVEGPDNGITFALSQTATGASNPDVDDALAMIGNEWITLIVNGMEIDDEDTLDKFSAWGEGRYGGLIHKPAVVFTGNTATTVASATTITDTRKTDRVNCQLVAPGSSDLPITVAARQVARIAKRASENPPTAYGDMIANGLTPGSDADQWDFAMRDAALLAGSSTVNVEDGVIKLGDIVTMYHPEGDDEPAYRYVVNIIKLMQLIHNTAQIFDNGTWGSGPLIPDGQATNNERARKPSGAKAAESAMIDQAALYAIVVNADRTKKEMQAGISGQNPNRLDMIVPVWLSGNANQAAITLDFGFYFGS